jgi:hypothetical protein
MHRLRAEQHHSRNGSVGRYPSVLLASNDGEDDEGLSDSSDEPQSPTVTETRWVDKRPDNTRITMERLPVRVPLITTPKVISAPEQTDSEGEPAARSSQTDSPAARSAPSAVSRFPLALDVSGDEERSSDDSLRGLLQVSLSTDSVMTSAFPAAARARTESNSAPSTPVAIRPRSASVSTSAETPLRATAPAVIKEGRPVSITRTQRVRSLGRKSIAPSVMKDLAHTNPRHSDSLVANKDSAAKRFLNFGTADSAAVVAERVCMYV